MPQSELALALVGFGNVGRRFLTLLDEAADRLEFQWRLVAIGTRHHGSLIDPDGIDARRCLTAIEGGGSLSHLEAAAGPRSGIDVVRQPDQDEKPISAIGQPGR